LGENSWNINEPNHYTTFYTFIGKRIARYVHVKYRTDYKLSNYPKPLKYAYVSLQ